MRRLLVEDDVVAAEYGAQGLRDEGHGLASRRMGVTDSFRATGGTGIC